VPDLNCGIGDIYCPRSNNRELSECVYCAHSGRDFHCDAWFAVPEMRDADQSVRQRSSARMGVAWREVPGLQSADFSDVPTDRIDDRFAVRSDVFAVRNYASDGEMAFFYKLHHCTDDYGFASATLAGSGDDSRDGGWTAFFGVCAAERWIWRLPSVEIVSCSGECACRGSA